MEKDNFEQELKKRIEQHKEKVLTKIIQKHYEDLYNTGIVIPIFMLEPPEKMAEKEVEQLKRLDYKEFNKLYDKAWKEYIKDDIC